MNTIQDVKNLVDIETIIQRYTGEELTHGFMRCPFHNERTASFSINKAKQKFKCFSCGEYSDVIGFTTKFFNLASQREGAEKLDKDFNLGVFVKDNKISSDYIKKVNKEKEREKRFEEKISRAYRIVADYYCSTYKDPFHDFNTELCGWLSDVLSDGTKEEKMEVLSKYGYYIRGIKEKS